MPWNPAHYRKIREVVKILEENKITNVGKNKITNMGKNTPYSETHSKEMQDKLEPIEVDKK